MALLSPAPAAAADTQVTLRPAAGPPRTVVELTGRRFPAGRRVDVLAGAQELATARAGRRGAFSASFTPSGGRRLVSASGRRRVTSAFRRSRRATVAEVASSTGRRLRWGPFAAKPRATLRIAGLGFRPRERVRVSLFGRLERLRASRRGRIGLTLGVPRRTGRRRGTVRAGGVSLPLWVTISARGSGGPDPSGPGASADALIAAAGDVACDPAHGSFAEGSSSTSCHHRQTSDLLLDPAIDAVLPLGDIQYEEGTLAQFMASYDPSWGRVKSITKPVVGNHEYLTSGAAGYFDYFGALAGERGKGYYAFDVGRWRWYVLNSNCNATGLGGCGADSPQVAWMTADLRANPRACVGAAWHHPRFSAANYSDDLDYEPFWKALYDAGAELVLVGHDHNYQRYTPIGSNGTLDPARGIREFVIGTGGRNHTAIVPRTDGLRETANGDAFGVLQLALAPHSYTWRFVSEAGTTYTDQGSTACH